MKYLLIILTILLSSCASTRYHEGDTFQMKEKYDDSVDRLIGNPLRATLVHKPFISWPFKKYTLELSREAYVLVRHNDSLFMERQVRYVRYKAHRWAITAVFDRTWSDYELRRSRHKNNDRENKEAMKLYRKEKRKAKKEENCEKCVPIIE